MTMQVTADDLESVIEDAVVALHKGVGKDWSVPAGSLRWSCSRTIFHAADDQVSYAGQLAARAQNHYLPFRLRPVRGTPPGGLLELLKGMGALLATTARAAPQDVRAFHPYGVADAEGFLAMGVAEVMLHTHDTAQGLALRNTPDPELCARVVARLHPGIDPHPDPWQLLLWATGRADLRGVNGCVAGDGSRHLRASSNRFVSRARQVVGAAVHLNAVDGAAVAAARQQRAR